MTQQGAALQNYNNELVKCERPRGVPARQAWGAGAPAGDRAVADSARPSISSRACAGDPAEAAGKPFGPAPRPAP